eukprot:NODE_234_length_3182_cov_43.854855_g204_i0.p1 GENE.NODE_234_length_3182_cov_43.854855_g204_i0~~NODE_234_length_3182_cov_43.854855_g204_i0.p1  ORF type:complete len:944 (+),score=277.10 NODE_234_length_3182_cov_43.854855_g204_i0:48-2879(+)
MEQNGFERIKVIGKGAFGSAILVRCKSDGKKYVAKEIELSRMKREEREEAQHEIKVLSKLNHPNIIRYNSSFEVNSILYIVMEYADGGDLDEKIKAQRGQRFDEDVILHYFVQVCMALKHLHDKKILHRDLKGQNIFLTSNNMVKLGDFGISTILMNTNAQARTMCGTPYYFSPELCQNRPYNNKSDIWSLGCVLYELTTLKHAFEGQNMKGLLQKIIRGNYPPVPTNYSMDLRNLIDSMLQRDPKVRPSITNILRLPFIQGKINQICGEPSVVAAPVAVPKYPYPPSNAAFPPPIQAAPMFGGPPMDPYQRKREEAMRERVQRDKERKEREERELNEKLERERILREQERLRLLQERDKREQMEKEQLERERVQREKEKLKQELLRKEQERAYQARAEEQRKKEAAVREAEAKKREMERERDREIKLRVDREADRKKRDIVEREKLKEREKGWQVMDTPTHETPGVGYVGGGGFGGGGGGGGGYVANNANGGGGGQWRAFVPMEGRANPNQNHHPPPEVVNGAFKGMDPADARKQAFWEARMLAQKNKAKYMECEVGFPTGQPPKPKEAEPATQKGFVQNKRRPSSGISDEAREQQRQEYLARQKIAELNRGRLKQELARDIRTPPSEPAGPGPPVNRMERIKEREKAKELEQKEREKQLAEAYWMNRQEAERNKKKILDEQRNMILAAGGTPPPPTEVKEVVTPWKDDPADNKHNHHNYHHRKESETPQPPSSKPKSTARSPPASAKKPPTRASTAPSTEKKSSIPTAPPSAPTPGKGRINRVDEDSDDSDDRDKAEIEIAQREEYRSMQSNMKEVLTNLQGSGSEDEKSDFSETEDKLANLVSLMAQVKMDGRTIQLPGVQEGDPLMHRIESLRMYVEENIGIQKFKDVYNCLSNISKDDDEDVAQSKAQSILGDQFAGFLPLIMQLIFCEDEVNIRANS